MPRLSRIRPLLTAAVLTAACLVGITSTTAAPAYADECYTWGRTLSSGASGDDVAQLQVRVAGWADGANITVDGSFGPQTAAAVRGFQAAYGLSADGVAGPATYAAIYDLQDADCSPAHFDWAEVDGGCGAGGYAGGSVSAAQVQANLLRAMWQAEALRHRLGDHPLTVTSGFRSTSCDASVGGSGSGQHTYGTALDLVGSASTLCQIASGATQTGYGGIYGPGYPDHDDHVHVDTRPGRSWSATTCGI